MAVISLPGAGMVHPQGKNIALGAVVLDVSAADAEFDRPVEVVSNTAGAVVVRPWNASADITVTYASDGTALAPGTKLPFAVRAVRNSGTTATQVVAFY